MRITTYIAIAVTLLAISCAKDEGQTTVQPDKELLAITITDSGYTSADGTASRAQEQGYQTLFTEGDEAGLYIVRNGLIIDDNHQIRLTAVGGQLQWQSVDSSKPLYSYGASAHYFVYYPYGEVGIQTAPNPEMTTAMAFFDSMIAQYQVRLDQTSYADYAASDLMVGEGTFGKDLVENNRPLSIKMQHTGVLATITTPTTTYKLTNAAGVSLPDDYILSPKIVFETGKSFCLIDGVYRRIINNPNEA
ncbi:MAG: fimbrillin family protein, partial [Alistipes sp.]